MVPLRPAARAFVVTILDAALIIAAGAAVVILLGGRTRIDVAGVRITLRTATNFLVFAAALGALRLWLGRWLRPLPALPRPDDAFLATERERFAAPERPTGVVGLYAAAALLGSLVWIAPHLLHIRQVPDAGDPLFSAWRVARLAHQLSTDPRHLFDGNQFYPLPLTLTYSDATFLQGLAELPLNHELDYIYFSTRHWARLLGGYSLFIPFDEALERSFRGFPSADAVEQLHRRGATHLTYNCRFEAANRSCAAVIDELDANPALELVAGGRWENAPIRLFRFR